MWSVGVSCPRPCLRRRAVLIPTVLAVCAAATPRSPAPAGPTTPNTVATDVRLLEDLAGRRLFPADNWWNQDISTAPVDADSRTYIDFLSGRTSSRPGAVRRLHPDFGPSPYGMPYVTVGSSQPRVIVSFTDYPAQSDVGAPGQAAGYPIPDEARTRPNYIQGGVAGGGSDGDRHLLIIDRDRWLLFETWATRWNDRRARWEAGSGAVFNLASNARRPEGWTSADAAGLAILPGLVRHDEVYGTGEIRHAFRCTARTTNGYVWPASKQTDSTPRALPMGGRLRLKSAVDLSGFPAPVQKIFRAMKTYGLVVADNGADLYVQGTMDARWNNDELNPAFARLTADDFEVIRLGWR